MRSSISLFLSYQNQITQSPLFHIQASTKTPNKIIPFLNIIHKTMVVLSIKRERQSEFDSITTMANCLMLLSRQENHFDTMMNTSPRRVFECKTCNRQFSSFQALGGHMASHKKPRIMGELNFHQLPTSPPKQKTHECSICGIEFPIGQALGGHMRRHRGIMNENLQTPHDQHVPVVNKSNSRRVLCLDLNLTPLENDLEFKLGKATPVVECYL